jgi:hypothetical protein
MKNVNLLFFLFLFCVDILTAQTPDFAWARQLDATGSSQLTLDANGNSYMAGVFAANSTINIGGITLNGSGSTENCFIAKFDAGGAVQWAKRMTRMGGLTGDNIDRIAVDDVTGNVYLCGFYLSGAVIDGQPLAGSYGYFLTCFSSTGILRWTRTMHNPGNTGNISLHLTGQGNIKVTALYNSKILVTATDSLLNTGNPAGVNACMATFDVTGNFLDAVELGVVNPSFNPATAYPAEIFTFDKNNNVLYRLVPQTRTIVKYDTDGTQLLTKTIACSGASTTLTSMAADRNGNIFVSGWFYNGSLTIEGTVVPKFGNATYSDAILVKLDDEGTFQWVKHYQYLSNDAYIQVRADELGNVYAIGQHAALGGDSRALLVKLSNDGDEIWEHLIVPGPGGPQDPSGVVQPQNLVQAHNGGNILVLGYYKERIYFDGNTSFSSPGIYKVFLAQYGVCNTPIPTISTSSTVFCQGDSVLLTASPASNYLWSTGDTVQSIFVSQTGNYYVSAIEGTECYGKSTNINMVSAPLPDNSVIQTGTMLTATESNATYQWINCATQAAIAGATAQSFSPGQNGNYAVEIINSTGCVVTSVCYTISGLGLSENTLQNSIILYPNPATDILYLSAVETKIGEVSIINTVGQQVISGVNLHDINISHLSSGTYFISVEMEKGIWKSRFVKR